MPTPQPTFQKVRNNFLKKLLLCFPFLLTLACNNTNVSTQLSEKQVDSILIDTVSSKPIDRNRELGFDNIESLEDTLAKYKETKELRILDCVENIGCYFEIRIGDFLQNGKRNAVVIIEKTGHLLLYNLENGVWQRIFELENDFVCGYDMGQATIKFEDVNGDNKVDILSIASVNYSTMVWYDLYLYQSKQKTWERIPFFDRQVPNPKFNHQNNLLYSYFFGSNYAQESRALYKWQGNEFVLYKEVTQQFIENRETAPYYHIKHYTTKKGEKVIQKEYKSKNSQIDNLLFSIVEYKKIK